MKIFEIYKVFVGGSTFGGGLYGIYKGMNPPKTDIKREFDDILLDMIRGGVHGAAFGTSLGVLSPIIIPLMPIARARYLYEKNSKDDFR